MARAVDKESKTSFQIRLEKNLLQKGKLFADKKGISLAGLFRQLLLEKLEAEEAKNYPGL